MIILINLKCFGFVFLNQVKETRVINMKSTNYEDFTDAKKTATIKKADYKKYCFQGVELKSKLEVLEALYTQEGQVVKDGNLLPASYREGRWGRNPLCFMLSPFAQNVSDNGIFTYTNKAGETNTYKVFLTPIMKLSTKGNTTKIEHLYEAHCQKQKPKVD